MELEALHLLCQSHHFQRVSSETSVFQLSLGQSHLELSLRRLRPKLVYYSFAISRALITPHFYWATLWWPQASTTGPPRAVSAFAPKHAHFNFMMVSFQHHLKTVDVRRPQASGAQWATSCWPAALFFCLSRLSHSFYCLHRSAGAVHCLLDGHCFQGFTLPMV